MNSEEKHLLAQSSGLIFILKKAIVITHYSLKKVTEALSFGHFSYRATALLDIGAIRDGEAWEFGWIQTCTFFQLRAKYKLTGTFCWKIPMLENGKTVHFIKFKLKKNSKIINLWLFNLFGL